MTPEERELRRALESRSAEVTPEFRSRLSSALAEGRPASNFLPPLAALLGRPTQDLLAHRLTDALRDTAPALAENGEVRVVVHQRVGALECLRQRLPVESEPSPVRVAVIVCISDHAVTAHRRR